MKICVIGWDITWDYSRAVYPYMLEATSIHDALEQRGHTLALARVSDRSETHIKRRSNRFPYTQVNQYEVLDVEDRSIDMFHFCELTHQVDPKLHQIINLAIGTGKPIVYSDGDAEIMSEWFGKNLRWIITKVKTTCVKPKFILHTICREYVEVAKQKYGVEAIYIPHFMSEGVIHHFKSDPSIFKEKEFVYLGSRSGRPHVIDFLNLVIENGMSADAGFFHFDRLAIKKAGKLSPKVGDISKLIGLPGTRHEYYNALAQYSFSYIGSGWHSKKIRPFITGNPPYTTFRLADTYLSDMLFVSYKTPELEGCDPRLLMDWNWNSLDEEKRVLTNALHIIADGEYDSLKADTQKRILWAIGPHVGERHVQLFESML